MPLYYQSFLLAHTGSAEGQLLKSVDGCRFFFYHVTESATWKHAVFTETSYIYSILRVDYVHIRLSVSVIIQLLLITVVRPDIVL